VEVERIADGLWRWTALHPDWQPGEEWDEEVSSYAIEAEGDLVLVDPLVPGEPQERDRFLEALDRDVARAGTPAIAITVHWHDRSTAELAERYEGATVWAFAPTAERVGATVTNPFAVGDTLPGGIEARAAGRDEAVLWIPAHRAVAAGDVLLGDADGGVRVCPDDWLSEGVDPADVRAALRGLLDLPVERILLGHGRPVLADAHGRLAAALA
jgi:hypothetical protein